MDTKFKINDKVYFLGIREISEGEIEGIKIEIRKEFEPRISYIVKFIDEDYEEDLKYMYEDSIFKTKLECAFSLLCDSADTTKWVNVYHDPLTDTYYTDSKVMFNTREAAVEAKNLQTLACSTMKYVDTVPVQINMNDNDLKQ